MAGKSEEAKKERRPRRAAVHYGFMEPLNEELVERIDQYIESMFTVTDDVLRRHADDADQAGLPAIHVSPNQGKLLYLLTKLAGARRVLEIGTLGGYSTAWLARALPPGGMLITLEQESRHAEEARRNLERAGLGTMVEIRVGAANEGLRALIREGQDPFNVTFIDADMAGHLEYRELCMQLSRPGTLILADNVIRNGIVMEDAPADMHDRGAKAYNEAVARHPRLESVIVPVVRRRMDGMAISIVRSSTASETEPRP
jgi:predicted O-methyltransferase YrrM